MFRLHSSTVELSLTSFSNEQQASKQQWQQEAQHFHESTSKFQIFELKKTND